MSRKLSTTIKDSAVPGKYKRVLEAYAAFANNDGTNIYACQGKIAGKASTSRRTIVRITPDLIASGVLKRGEKHTCKIKECDGGSRHYCGRIGKWTNVYEINIGLVQNVPNLLVTNCLRANEAKCRKPRAAKCLTDSGIKETPVLLGKEEDSSVSEPDGVSQQARQTAEVASSESKASEDCTSKAREEIGNFPTLVQALAPLVLEFIKPFGQTEDDVWSACEGINLFRYAFPLLEVFRFIWWINSHKPESLRLHSADQFTAAIRGKDGQFSALNQYKLHRDDHNNCKLCKDQGWLVCPGCKTRLWHGEACTSCNFVEWWNDLLEKEAKSQSAAND